ncbi:MAG: ATP synthase F1 subunit epsilon [Candidatus Sericytochromatia bacterium]|uniref:ATP synthase epsilon chain n=1 Tax=Candidatus Tanganyikabacteria bacterium TaxID=2961651 RepID=A0A937X2E6_9BACT|nr:ATP synthase F1 subunit epsilon [Candidatus Tanganyikabacteria bacterium]
MPFTLEVITPDRVVMRESVDFVQARGEEGELGILPGHTPFFTALATDLMIVRKGTEEEIVAVMGGFMEVRPDHVTVLAPAAERATEIDEMRAREAQDQSRISVDREKTVESEAALQRALVRMRAIEIVQMAKRLRK